MRKLLITPLVLLLIPFSGAQAGLVFNISTGYNNATQSLFAANSIDTKYTVIGPAPATTSRLPQTRVASGLPNTYTPDNSIAGSLWDYLVDNSSRTGEFDSPVGNYTATTTFSMDGFDPTTAQLDNVQTSADNALLSVIINGKTVFSQTQAEGLVTSFSSVQNLGNLGLGAFQSGLNTIQFTFFNQGFGGGDSQQASPAAFRVGGTVDANALNTPSVPEPSSLMLLTLGATCVFVKTRRRWGRVAGVESSKPQ